MSSAAAAYDRIRKAERRDEKQAADCEGRGHTASAAAHRAQAGGLRIAMSILLEEMTEVERREVEV